VRRLHLNEASIPPSPAAIAAMRAAAAGLHRYPDHEPTVLAEALAERSGVPAPRIVFGNGSSEVLVAAVQIALRADDEAVFPVPCFPLYEKAVGWQRGRAVGVPTRADGTPDVSAMLKAIGPRCRIVIAATPNNPTGGLMSADDVRALMSGVPDDVLLVLDEAYYEFGRMAGGAENLPLLSRRAGLWLITRTFSKAHGLAGIRIGYGLCGTSHLADTFRGWRPNFSVNSVAQAGALAALADDAHTTGVLRINARERSRLVVGPGRGPAGRRHSGHGSLMAGHAECAQDQRRRFLGHRGRAGGAARDPRRPSRCRFLSRPFRNVARVRREIAAWRHAELAAEHGNKGARALIAEV
jgi:histidinol-phosphate aminotransferase